VCFGADKLTSLATLITRRWCYGHGEEANKLIMIMIMMMKNDEEICSIEPSESKIRLL